MTLSAVALLRLLLVGIVLLFWWQALRPRGSIGAAVFASLLVVLLWAAHARWRRRAARRFIRTQPLPSFLRGKLQAAYPALQPKDLDDVEQGLRQFFVASAMAGGRFVAMPSKVVDTLWHEFILHTRGYEAFCRRAFGGLLHHTPAEAMPAAASVSSERFVGLRRAWYWSCNEERIDPRRPRRLPLLFALDGRLAIDGGYRYVPDCRLLGADRGDTHCAAGYGCGSSCGSSSGSSDGGGGDGGGDGGGCGGGD
jgi:hypothetical protein